jgi:UDP-N-acetylglucosamine acyltransferase
MIHPTAVIHPKAKLDPTVQVGPFVVIDEAVEIGADCVIGPHVYITGVTKIGRENQFHAGCVIGDAPQDLKYNGALTGLRIGDKNVFREQFTVHRSAKVGEETVIGSNNFIMQHSHVAHNCIVGDNVILASGALLGGHAEVQDRAFISGNCLVHQFVRVGTLAMMQGGAAISMDLPPFTIASQVSGNSMCGLNIVGLRRAGLTSDQRLELKALYRDLFRSGVNLRAALVNAQSKYKSAPARTLLDFVASSKRGVCSDVGSRAGDSTEE